MFIHPEVVMSAGHCCAAGATKAICGGKERPGRKLAESVATFTAGLLTQGVLTFSTTIQPPYRYYSLLKMGHPLQAQGC